MDDATSDPVTGLTYVAAQGTSTRHLAEPGAMLTLCGRIALYRLHWMRRAKPCRRCQQETMNESRGGAGT